MKRTTYSCYKKESVPLIPSIDRDIESLVTKTQSIFRKNSEIEKTLIAELRISPGAS